MSSGKYIASFIVDPSGEFEPTELGPEALDSGKVVIVIDEPSKKIYVWLGKATSQNNRMGARRAVKSIPTFGLRKEGVEFPLGRDCSIVEVEESLVESNSANSVSLAELLAMLKKPHTRQGAGIWRVEDISLSGSAEPKLEAKILERRIKYEMSHLERETIVKKKNEKQEENSK